MSLTELPSGGFFVWNMPQRSVFARYLHHMYGLAPDVIVFGGPWLDRTRLVLRHKYAQ
jgi:hypothetical protein